MTVTTAGQCQSASMMHLTAKVHHVLALGLCRMEAQNITILFDHIYDTRILLECLCEYTYISVIHSVIEYINQLSLISIPFYCRLHVLLFYLK